MADPTQSLLALTTQNDIMSTGHTETYQAPQTFNRESAFRPTPARGVFAPTLDAIYQPQDVLSAKLDLLLDHNKTTDSNFESLRTDITSIKADLDTVHSLTEENIKIKQHLSVALGRINRLEQKEEHTHDKIVKLEQHSFSKDIVIYNLPESQPETIIQLRNKIYDLFNLQMLIPLEYIFSLRNPGGEVRIENCFRLGKTTPNKARPVIVSLLTHIGKQIVTDKVFVKNLTKTTKTRIAQRYQSEIREKRETLVSTLKSLRDDKKNKNERINLVNDKILVNNKVYEDKNFVKDPLSALTHMSIHYDYIQHGTELSESDSFFQGHSAVANDIPQAIAAKNSIFQNPDLSTCDHMIYAYRIKDGEGKIQSGYSDDHETKGGKILFDLLVEKDKKEHFLCVTRLKKGNNIGPVRFELIKKAATQVLDMPNKPEVPDKFYLRLC